MNVVYPKPKRDVNLVPLGDLYYGEVFTRPNQSDTTRLYMKCVGRADNGYVVVVDSGFVESTYDRNELVVRRNGSFILEPLDALST